MNRSCSFCPSFSVDSPIVQVLYFLPGNPPFRTMKLCVSLVLCIVAFLSQDAVNCQKMPPSRTTASKPSASGKVTHKSHDATSFPTRTQKTVPSHIPKSSGKVPTEYTKIPTSRTLKTSVMPTIGTTSSQKPKPPISGPTSAKPPKSSPPQATTVAKSKTTQNSTRTSKVATSASKTLTVSDGQTASAQVGWIVIGLGVGGSVYVGGNIIPIAGGTEGIIEENSSGQDEVVPIDTSTAPTRTDTSTTRTSTSSTSTSTSKSKSKSKSKSTSKLTSSSTSSSTASPTPYNIYPKLDSTARQQLAFAQDLEQVAQPGSVKSITGARDKLLLWVASLTPAQASELSRNPVVSPLPGLSSSCDLNVLNRSGILMWIRHYRIIWKAGVKMALLRHQTVLPRNAHIKSAI